MSRLKRWRLVEIVKKGKGAPETWVAVVRRGRIMFEIDGITPAVAQEGMSRAAAKLGIKTRFVSRSTMR